MDWGRELKVGAETDRCVQQDILNQELLVNTDTELVKKHDHEQTNLANSSRRLRQLFAHWTLLKWKAMQRSRVLPGTEDHWWWVICRLFRVRVHVYVCVCVYMYTHMFVRVYVYASVWVWFFLNVSFVWVNYELPNWTQTGAASAFNPWAICPFPPAILEDSPWTPGCPETHCEAQNNPELPIFLPTPPECEDCRQATSTSAPELTQYQGGSPGLCAC